MGFIPAFRALQRLCIRMRPSACSEKFNKILLNIRSKSVTIILTKFLKSFKIDGGLKNE